VADHTLGLVVWDPQRADADGNVVDEPQLTWRDASGRERAFPLVLGCDRVLIGRSRDSDLHLEGDPRVSRRHAVLERTDTDWIVVDDRLSRNGTFVNGERVRGRRPLHDGDLLRIGRTLILFQAGLER